uniref:Uncharacterized protein n=1 Tax=Ascaris lumbricoides TaxID=6252 RepID=A0A9J2PMT9_ASCLU
MSMAQNQPSSGLIVPIVLWGKNPPRNRISCIQPLPDGKTIVTGSFDGELIIWEISEGRLNALIMIVGHESPITAISSTGVSTISTRFVSASGDGQLSLWESGDGRSVDTVLSSYVHRHIVPYCTRCGSHNLCRLYCVGEYAEVIVLDPQDLNVLFTLSSRVEPDWISSLAFFKTSENIDCIIGVSMGGMMKVWRLIDLDKKDGATPLYEQESKSVGVCEVRCVAWASCNHSMILVVTANSWQIFDLADLNRLFTVSSDETLCDGTVVDVDRIAIATSSGSVQLFQLPRSTLSGDDISLRYGAHPTDVGGHKEPFLYAALQGYRPARTVWPTQIAFYFDYHPETFSCTVFRADVNGSVSMWTLPAMSEVEVAKRYSKPDLYKASHETSLASLWRILPSLPPSVFEINDNRSITATLYVSAQGRLVLGRDDGSILIVYACEAISKQLLDTPGGNNFLFIALLVAVLIGDVSCRHLLGHASTVTCLLYPYEEHHRYDVQIIVSGSADFSVIVWNLNTGSRLHRFCVQGGPILRLLIPPENCNARVLHTICAIAGDNSAALLSLKENKCLLLASRQLFPIIEVRWRPLDDFLLLKCEDDSVYVWQMDTANLERVISGLMSDEVMCACDEQIGIVEGDDEAGASHTVQMFRAFKNKNVNVIRQIAGSAQEEKQSSVSEKEVELPSPMSVQPLSRNPDAPHIVFFNVDSLIVGLLSVEGDAASQLGQENKSLSTILRGRPSETRAVAPRIVWQTESNLYLDVAKLCLSLLHAWTLDADLDAVCLKKLKLLKPAVPLSFGVVSRQGHMSLLLPKVQHWGVDSGNINSFDYFANTIRWVQNSSLTTVHLLTIISLANTLMSLRGASFENIRKKILVRYVMSLRNAMILRGTSLRSSSSDSSEGESQLRQGWSLLAALHCCLLPDLVKPKSAYCSPRIELLARRWQDRCVEVRLAAQALLTRELARLGSSGRRHLVESWAAFLPTLLDPTLSIFGARTLVASMNTAPPSASSTQPQPPPIPPRSNQISLPDTTLPDITRVESESGVQQIRRNQATAVILLGVVGAEFPDEMMKMDVSRATAHCLLELLVAPASQLLPFHSPLRRAAIDLIGRGFGVWQPHLDISKVLLGLLDLAASTEKNPVEGTAVLSPLVDIRRTARHALCLIATSRPPALITALSKEVSL